MQLAGEKVEQVEVAAVEEQVDEAQHGSGTHHLPRQVGQPNHGLNHPHCHQVQPWESGDHGVPLEGEGG